MSAPGVQRPRRGRDDTAVDRRRRCAMASTRRDPLSVSAAKQRRSTDASRSASAAAWAERDLANCDSRPLASPLAAQHVLGRRGQSAAAGSLGPSTMLARHVAHRAQKLSNGDVAGARRFALKAQSISGGSGPQHVAAAHLLKELDALERDGGAVPRPSASPSAAASTSSSAPTASTSKAKPKADAEPRAPRAFTPLQEKTVKRIRACKPTAFYEILELERTCDDAAIKKAFRKVRRWDLDARSCSRPRIYDAAFWMLRVSR